MQEECLPGSLKSRRLKSRRLKSRRLKSRRAQILPG
jgi:hypothetical protein